MPQPNTQVEQKTGTNVFRVIGVALAFAVGAAATAAAFWFMPAPQKTTSTVTQTSAKNTANTAVDLSTAALPTAGLSVDEYASKVLATAVPGTPTGVSLAFTNPTEGGIASGTALVAIQMTDPQGQAAGVRVETFNDRYHYWFSWGFDSQAPYEFRPNLGLYPSGEYRHVAYALASDGSVLATTDVMVTWAHTCYYALPDVTLTAPTSSVTAGTSFTLTGSVKNNIRGACDNAYILTSTLPTGWTAAYTPTSPASIPLRGTQEVTLQINVPSSQTAGTFPVTFTSTRQSTGLTDSASVDVVIAAPSRPGGQSEVAP